MTFKQRWGFIAAVFITAFVVYFMPMGNMLSRHCNCPKEKCKDDPDLTPHDMIILNDDLKNTSFTELHRKHSKSGEHVKIPGARGTDLQQTGWVRDCVTWEPKWETVTLEAEPHLFSLDSIKNEHRNGETDEHREQLFVDVFKKQDWPAKDPIYTGLQASGPGAMLTNTQGIMAVLHVVITKLKQQLGKSRISLLDLPCGDLQWMKRFLMTRNDIDYTGADIVPDLIAHHKKTHSNLQRAKFIHHDIVKTPLNESFDLIICRDMLQHLWKYDAMKALYRFAESKSKYLLATTYPDTTQNEDVEKDALGGRKFSYNLELPPFSLVPPVCMSYDWNVEHIALWNIPLKQKYEM